MSSCPQRLLKKGNRNIGHSLLVCISTNAQSAGKIHQPEHIFFKSAAASSSTEYCKIVSVPQSTQAKTNEVNIKTYLVEDPNSMGICPMIDLVFTGLTIIHFSVVNEILTGVLGVVRSHLLWQLTDQPQYGAVGF